MTKQEEIQDLMDNCWEECNPDYPKLLTFRPMKFLNEIMPYLHSQGVVIKRANKISHSIQCRLELNL